MFYVSKIEGKEKFYVTDTADGVTECLSRADLIRAVDKGICIEGVIGTKRNGKKDVGVVSDELFNSVVTKLGEPVYLVWGRDEDEYLFALYVGLIFDGCTNENYICLFNKPAAFSNLDKSFRRQTSISDIIAVPINKILLTKGVFIKSARPVDDYGIQMGFKELMRTQDLNSIRLL